MLPQPLQASDGIALWLSNMHITPPRNDVGAVSSEAYDQTSLHRMVEIVEASNLALSVAKDEFKESKKALDTLKESLAAGRREGKSGRTLEFMRSDLAVERQKACMAMLTSLNTLI
ncbi:hypothetical protein EYR36_002364 [Pleurotus pulmonarius]|nr:hypothetical protein EYR36_002364 [Pleurotus pulmonarius]